MTSEATREQRGSQCQQPPLVMKRLQAGTSPSSRGPGSSAPGRLGVGSGERGLSLGKVAAGPPPGPGARKHPAGSGGREAGEGLAGNFSRRVRLSGCPSRGGRPARAVPALCSRPAPDGRGATRLSRLSRPEPARGAGDADTGARAPSHARPRVVRPEELSELPGPPTPAGASPSALGPPRALPASPARARSRRAPPPPSPRREPWSAGGPEVVPCPPALVPGTFLSAEQSRPGHTGPVTPPGYWTFLGNRFLN